MNNGSTTIKFNNKSKNRDYNIYVEEFFGGSDVFVYINGQRIHNISHLQFAIQERHKPIYGYGSRTYDDVAVGDRIVIGAMKIPVKNPHNNGDSSSSSKDISNRSFINDDDVYVQKSVPEWVYNYKDNIENTIETVDKKDDSSILYKVQEYFNLEKTGVLDFDTKVKISKFRESKGLHPGCYIDNDLLNAIDNEYMSVESLGENFLYLDPSFKRTICHIHPNDKMTVIAYDDNSYFVRLKDNKSGYVKKEEVCLI